MNTLKLLLKILLLLLLPIAIQMSIFGALFLISKDTPNLDKSGLVIWLLAITNGLIILILWGSSAIKRQGFIKHYALKPITTKQIGLSLGIGLAAMFVSLGISGLFALESLDPDAAASLESLVGGPFIFTLLAIGVIAPIGEELIFRGAILRLLKTRMPAYGAVFVQALLFGFYHLNLVQAPPTAVLGIFLGLVVLYTGSLWPAIIIHIVNNSLAISLSQLGAGQDAAAQAAQAAAKPGPLYFILIALVALTLVVLQLKKLKETQVITD